MIVLVTLVTVGIVAVSALLLGEVHDRPLLVAGTIRLAKTTDVTATKIVETEHAALTNATVIVTGT